MEIDSKILAEVNILKKIHSHNNRTNSGMKLDFMVSERNEKKKQRDLEY